MEQDKHKDGGYSWIIVLSSFSVALLTDGVKFSFGVMLPVLVEAFNETTAPVAAIGGAFLGSIALTSPFAGSLSDAFGRQHVTIVGTLMYSCGLLVSSFARNIGLLYLTYGILCGSGYGLMLTPPLASVMEHFTKRRALAVGVAVCGAGVGTFVMNHLTNFLLDTYGWRGTFLVLSGIMLNGIPCGLALPRANTKIAKTEHTKQHCPPKNDGQCTCSCIYRSFKKLKHATFGIMCGNLSEVFRDVQCLCILLSCFSFGLCFFVPFSFLPKQALAMGMEAHEAAWLTSSIGISNTLSRVVVGWLGNRSFVNVESIHKCLVLLTAVSLSTSTLLTSFETKLIFACVYGALFGGFVATVPVRLAGIVPVENIGQTTGLFLSMMNGANIIGTPLAGWTIDVTGDYYVCYLLAGGEALIALGFLMLPQIRDCCGTKGNIIETTHL